MSIVFFFDQKTPRRRPYHRTKKTIDDVFISRPLTAHYRLKRNSTFKKKRRSTFLSPTQGLSSSDEASTPLLSASIAKVGSDGAFAREGVDKEEAAVTQTEETAPSNGVLPPVDVHTVSPPLISATSAALTSSRLKILAELEEERDDDGQEQYSFQEAQFAAPGILQQLSKLIYLADREEAIKWCPEGLIATLRSEYRSLTRGVKVARRQWQTVSYRYTAEMSREESEGDVRLPIIVMEGSDGERRKEGRTRRRLEMSVSISEVEMLKEEQKANGDDVGAVPSIFGLGREMSKSPRGQQPRTRLERYHVVGVHERGSTSSNSSRQVHIGPHGHYEEVLKDYSSTPVRGSQTICFSLSSPFAAERGWLKEPVDSEDPERRTLLEWLLERSRKIRKQREVERKEAVKRGSTGPLIVRYYEKWPKLDAARMKFEARMRQARLKRQGVDTSLDELEEKRCLMNQLPDGTTFCFYLSGQTAICRTSGGSGLTQKYTYAYDQEGNMLACFLPSGKGCGYYKEGALRVLVDVDEGLVFDEDGIVTRKWKWPAKGLKLQPSVIVQLNEHIQLRCLSQTNIMLYFTCHKEIVKFQLSEPVQFLPSPPPPSSDEACESPLMTNQLLTNVQFTSQTALDMCSVNMQRPSSKKSKKKPLKSGSATQKQKAQNVTASNVLGLDTIEEEGNDDLAFSTISTDLLFSLNIKVLEQNQVDLQTIQEKTKLLTNEWMDHYRKTLGITPRSSPRNSPAREISFSHGHYRRWSAEDGQGAVTSDGSKAIPVQSILPLHRRSVSAEPVQCTSRVLPSPLPGLRQTVRSRWGHESVIRFHPRKIPLLYDKVYDYFIQKELSHNQLLVVYVCDSRLGADSSGCDTMLERIYYSHNKNRIKPSNTDLYRIVKYDLAVAAEESSSEVPLLQRRHNAIAGMIFIYQSGRLLFANKIFNGYGNLKKDFMKQLMKCADDFRHGHFLLPNFRFGESRTRSRSIQKAWIAPGSVEQLSEISHKEKPGFSISSRVMSQMTSIGFITQSLSSEENLSQMHASHFHDLIEVSPDKPLVTEPLSVSTVVGNA